MLRRVYPGNFRCRVRTNGAWPYLCEAPFCALVRENRGLGSSWISWVVVGGGAAVLWSAVGIERSRRAELRRRLLLWAGFVVVGFGSLAFSTGSSETAAGARRVADSFTMARLTQGAAGAERYLAPDAAPLAARLPAGATKTLRDARRIVATGVSLECGQTPILQTGPRSERCVSYDDGSRVFLWRHGGQWFVVGFAVR
jgi:hypothetical protein